MSLNMTQTTSEQLKVSVVRVSLACIQCRSRHVRCDAVRPSCNRCTMDGTTCVYQKSKRGGNRRRLVSKSQDHVSQGCITSPFVSGGGQFTEHEESEMDQSFEIQHQTTRESESYSSGVQMVGIPPIPDIISPPIQILKASSANTLLELYFRYFHISHPCIAPLRFLKEKVSTFQPGAELLLNVLRFVGSLYVEDIASEPFEYAILKQIPAESSVWVPFEVQAVFIYAIAVFWRSDSENARKWFDLVIDKAVAIGMNKREFATSYSPNEPVFSESWRRTWYEIYICDGHMASTTRSTTYSCSQNSLKTTVDLPCEEEAYNEGVCHFHDLWSHAKICRPYPFR
jgi:hypothetical protein